MHTRHVQIEKEERAPKKTTDFCSSLSASVIRNRFRFFIKGRRTRFFLRFISRMSFFLSFSLSFSLVHESSWLLYTHTTKSHWLLLLSPRLMSTLWVVEERKERRKEGRKKRIKRAAYDDDVCCCVWLMFYQWICPFFFFLVAERKKERSKQKRGFSLHDLAVAIKAGGEGGEDIIFSAQRRESSRKLKAVLSYKIPLLSFFLLQLPLPPPPPLPWHQIHCDVVEEKKAMALFFFFFFRLSSKSSSSRSIPIVPSSSFWKGLFFHFFL